MSGRERTSKETVKQIHVLKGEGLTNKQISKTLGVSVGTIRNYLDPNYLKKNNEVKRQVDESKEVNSFNRIMQLMRVTQ